MKVSFTERKMSASDSLREYAVKKLSKLDRYFGKETEASVAFSCEREQQSAEITVHTEGLIFRAQERTTDMYASIDGAVASIDRQVQKNKTKIAKNLRQGLFENAIPEMNDYHDETFELVREKSLSVKPMSTEDAILQMNLLGHSFFFFMNIDRKGAPCVVYARKDGGYGMLVADK